MPSKIRGTKDVKVVDRERSMREPILAMTPKDAVKWVDDNVTDFASMKKYQKTLTAILVTICHDANKRG